MEPDERANYQIYSNQRGWLTSDPGDHFWPSVNNAVDVVWSQSDTASGRSQIYKIAAGNSVPVQVTSNDADHVSPSISNAGEVVWMEGNGGGMRIYSDLRGQLSFDGCPGGLDHMMPSVNACGDVAFTVVGTTWPRVYRLGSNAPCYTPPPVTDVTLTASPASPQLVNTPVTFTATASGGSGAVEYEFSVKDPVSGKMTLIQPYGPSNTFSYTPTNDGTYSIQVYARNVGSPALYEAVRWSAYNVTSIPPVEGVTISASPASPQLVNTPVTFTAAASGGTGAVEYEFSVKDPVSGQMTVMQPYGPSNTFSYTPTNDGTYSIQVYARNVGSPTLYEAVRWSAFTVTQ